MGELQNEEIIEKTEEEKKWCVYMHTNKCNNKVYVGLTSKSPKHRWGTNGSRYPKQQIAFRRAIEKYGWDNFEHIIFMENLTAEEAKHTEKLLIALYKTNCHKYQNPSYGYNMTDGGDGVLGIPISAETRKKMSIAKKGLYIGENNPNYGREYSEKDIIRLRKAHQHEMKAVVQLDLHNNVIAHYECIREASRKTKTNRQCLGFCLQGKYKTANGFCWMYKEEYEKQLQNLNEINKER